MSARSRLSGAVAAVSLLLAACGLGSDDEPRAIDAEQYPTSAPEETTAATPPDEPSETSQVVDVYFVRVSGDRARLAPLERTVPATRPRSVLEALLVQTPREAERAQGYTTHIPASTALASSPELRGDGVLVVDLNSGIYEIQGDTLRNALGQIVCTLTTLDPVTSVVFEVDGERVRVPRGDNVQTDQPLRCSSYANLLDPSAPTDGTAPAGDDPAIEVDEAGEP